MNRNETWYALEAVKKKLLRAMDLDKFEPVEVEGTPESGIISGLKIAFVVVEDIQKNYCEHQKEEGVSVEDAKTIEKIYSQTFGRDFRSPTRDKDHPSA